MSPEISLSQFATAFFSAPFVRKNLVVVAIDEAHCITDWYVVLFSAPDTLIYHVYRGAEFRPMFSKLGNLRATIKAPFMALTATASENTYRSIVESLHLDNPVVVSRSLDRPNIYFSVSPVKGVKVSMAKAVKSKLCTL